MNLYPEQIRVLQQLKGKRKALVIAKTGSGKTYTALKKIQMVLDEEGQNAKGLYLAPTNILIQQHYETAKKIFKHHVHLIKVGSNLQSLKEPGKRLYIMTGHYGQVLLRKNLIPLGQVKVSIFDEVHKAKSINSSYVTLSKALECNMYGFTASPGTQNVIKSINTNMGFEHTIKGQSPFDYKRDLNFIVCHQNPTIKRAHQALHKYISLRYSKIYDVLNKTRTISLSSYLLSMMRSPRFRTFIERLCPLFLYYQFFGYLFLYETLRFECPTAFLESVQRTSHKFKIRIPEHLMALVRRGVYPSKYDEIYERIKANDGTVLVFFENFITCKDFQRFLTSKGHTDHLVIAGKAKMKAKERKKVLEEKQNTRVLLATSVIEQGISINVDEVVFYKPICNSIRYVQRQGRTGRYKDGRISVLYYKDTHESHAIKVMENIKSKM